MCASSTTTANLDFCHPSLLLYHLRQWTMDSVWSTKCLLPGFMVTSCLILLFLMRLQFDPCCFYSLILGGSVRNIAFSLCDVTKAGTVWSVGVICGFIVTFYQSRHLIEWRDMFSPCRFDQSHHLKIFSPWRFDQSQHLKRFFTMIQIILYQSNLIS